MKNLILISSLLVAELAFAGGSVGTMKTADGRTIQVGNIETVRKLDGLTRAGTGGGGVLGRPQIIYNMGQKNGLVKYAHGQLQNGEWVVAEVVDAVDSVIENSEFVKALTESQLKQDWVELK